ncbi:MAG: class I adenylate cyclase [Vibrio sp.]
MQAYSQSLIDRLDRLNQQRVDRALSIMDKQTQQVFHLIPVFLHLNHPNLPGNSLSNTPSGVFDYSLSTIQVQSLQAFNFDEGVNLSDLTKPSSKPPAILALYTMGSTSSMGQSSSSDLDIWVCVSPEMPQDERISLINKCLSITDWAKDLGVEANFFLMDESRFRSNISEEMTGDNCGSTQHLLLLDEFYRSAVRLAGQRLLWQIVPPEMEECYDEYVAKICREGHLNRSEWIDFGQLHRIPAEEYFGSNLWQLYKSIDSPYKSVLKAILLESYSWEYPQPRLLSVEAKRRFFAHERKEYCMDSYYVMLVKVTQYLQRIGDTRRLELVRRCFYLKTHEKLSRPDSDNDVLWRRKAIKDMVESWGWDDELIKRLDNRRHWKVEQVKVVHKELLDALMLSYRNLIQFARRNDITSAISPEDISILARKLYAAFEILPGKVTLLNAQISPDLHEPDLTFIQVPEGRVNKAGWYLYKQPLVPAEIIGRAPLEHNQYLSKLVAWGFFNGLITEATHLDAVVRHANLDIDKLYQMVSDLRNTFSLRKRQPSMQALASPCEVGQLSIFINLETDPTVNLTPQQLKVNPKNPVDVFSFSDQQICLVSSVDLVYRNSWHEVRTLHFEGQTAIIEALKTILGKMHQDAQPPESVDVFCYSKHMRGLIRNMVYQLLAECIDLRLMPVINNKRRRFKVLKIANQMHGLFFERRGVSVMKLENSIDFYSSISSNKLQGVPLLKVGKSQELPPPDVVDAYASEGLIQFFFEGDDDGFNIYVLDEQNHVEVYRQFDGNRDDMIRTVNNFYTNNTQDGASKAQCNFNLPQYYQIIHPDQGESYVVPYRSSTPFATGTA